MIPKTIHYCWFGNGEIPEKDKRCIESWKKYCPDYQIMQWNEKNYDIQKNQYMYDAYQAKKWGFVPDYARFDIVYTHGGIYMDTDVEVIKSLDSLLSHKAYMGFEEGNFVNGGIGFGSEPGNEVMKELRDMYEQIRFIKPNGKINTLPSPYYITDYLETLHLKRNGQLQDLGDVVIYPSDFFSPKEFSTGEIHTTENTYTIHHYNASWMSQKDRDRIQRSRKLNKCFGKAIGARLEYVLNKCYRLYDLIIETK